MRQREQRGRHLHLRHCSSRRDARYASNASSSLTGSMLSMATSWVTSSPGWMARLVSFGETTTGAACAPGAFAWTPHKARRTITATSARERVESVEGMFADGVDLQAEWVKLAVHTRIKVVARTHELPNHTVQTLRWPEAYAYMNKGAVYSSSSTGVKRQRFVPACELSCTL